MGQPLWWDVLAALADLDPEVEPLAVPVRVEVGPQLQLVVGVRDPHGLRKVPGLKPVETKEE